MNGDLRGARGVALVVRFLLELALLVGSATWMLTALPDPWRWVAALAVVVAIGTVWGLFLSPRRRFDLGGAGRLIVENLLFGGIAAGLVSIGHPMPAIVGLGVWVVDRVALALLPAEPAAGARD